MLSSATKNISLFILEDFFIFEKCSNLKVDFLIDKFSLEELIEFMEPFEFLGFIFLLRVLSKELSIFSITKKN